MGCRRVKKIFLDYVEGELPHSERERVSSHIEGCRACADLVEKLEFSARVLSDLPALEMSAAAGDRVLEALSREGAAGKRALPTFLRSARALATGAVVAAFLLAAAVVVGVFVTGDDQRELKKGAVRETATGSAEVESAPGTAPESGLSATPDLEEKGVTEEGPLPQVTQSANDYTEESLRQMMDRLEIADRFASGFTMNDAVRLGLSYSRFAAGRFGELGEDAPLLEAIISYIMKDEPVMLPCYIEKADFRGRDVYIIAFSAPPRRGKSVNLTRREIWVMDPARFAADPDGSVVYFLEQK